MKKIHLTIPHIQEGPCCRRARWLRQFGWRLNLTNAAICVGEVIAMFAWDKTLPSWYDWIRWPVLLVILSIIFFNHRLGSFLTFLPEAPDPLALLAELAAFPTERRDERPKNGPSL